MNNEDKILAMLEGIAQQVTTLTETIVTKDDLRSFNEEINDWFDKMDERFDKMEEKMVTKAELTMLDENNATRENSLTKTDQQSELLEARLDVLNDRLFT